MAYRDELEAAQARAESLERDLKQTREELALVKRGESRALATREGGALARSDDGGKASRRWLGAPTSLSYARTVEGEIPDSSHTELIEKMRSTLHSVGTTTVLPGSLAWGSIGHQSATTMVNIYITSRDGITNIRAEQKLANLAGGIFGGVGGGVGGGGIMAPIAVALVAPVLVPFAVGAWLGGTYYACRKLYRSRTRIHAVRLEALLDDLVEIAEKHIRRAAEADATPG